jgi:hypothetical protein
METLNGSCRKDIVGSRLILQLGRSPTISTLYESREAAYPERSEYPTRNNVKPKIKAKQTANGEQWERIEPDKDWTTIRIGNPIFLHF